MIRLEKRPQPSALWSSLTPVLAVVLTIVAGGILFAILGKNPFVAIRSIFWDPIFGAFSSYYLPQLLVKAGPLILIANGLAIGFRAGIWNIGAEGQYIIGAVCAAAAALAFYPSESVFIWPLMILAGGLGGFFWAMIPALLRVRFGTNEILVSLMLVYVAENLVNYAAIGPLRNPEGRNFPGSRNLSAWDATSNGEIIAGTGMHWGVAAAFIAVLLTYIMMARHILGFQIRLAGQAPKAAGFAGVSAARLVLICMGIAGVLAGLAGMFEVAGPARSIKIDFGAGYGFTAIIVAFLGRLHPIGILMAGLLMGLTYIGGEVAQQNLQLPVAAIQVFQGMLLFFLLAVDVLTNYRVRWGEGVATQ